GAGTVREGGRGTAGEPRPPTVGLGGDREVTGDRGAELVARTEYGCVVSIGAVGLVGGSGAISGRTGGPSHHGGTEVMVVDGALGRGWDRAASHSAFGTITKPSGTVGTGNSEGSSKTE